MEHAATRIQASWKGHAVRRELVHHVRRDFEETVRRLEGGLAVRDVNVQISPPTSVGWKTTGGVSRPILASPVGVENDVENVFAKRAVETTKGHPIETSSDETKETVKRLAVLRKEMQWALRALDDRRQHLRRLRFELSLGGGQ